MNAETALRINGALCHVWFALRVFRMEPEASALAIVAGITQAQAETANEVVEALNAEAPRKVGEGGVVWTTHRATVSTSALPDLLTDARRLVEGRAP